MNTRLSLNKKERKKLIDNTSWQLGRRGSGGWRGVREDGREEEGKLGLGERGNGRREGSRGGKDWRVEGGEGE